jgi:catechol 2,3-dioxygenase-like lactoylglutathione lyase family enzyme
MSDHTTIPSVGGLFEVALYVDDLERSREFYTSLFGFRVVVPGDRVCGLSVCDRQMLLLFRHGGATEPSINSMGDTVPPHNATGQQHLAISIADADYDAWKRRLEELEIPIESEVAWKEGGHSIYFRDPDGHSIELATPAVWPGVRPESS